MRGNVDAAVPVYPRTRVQKNSSRATSEPWRTSEKNSISEVLHYSSLHFGTQIPIPGNIRGFSNGEDIGATNVSRFVSFAKDGTNT